MAKGNEASAKTEAVTKSDLDYSTKDGVASAVMTGAGDNYVSAFAVKMGADDAFIGTLSSVPPFVAAVAQIGSVRVMKALGRKRAVLLMAQLQAVSWLLIAGLALMMNGLALDLLLVIYTSYLVFGAIANGPWTSWISDIVPAGERANYFAERNKWIAAASVGAIICAGLILQAGELDKLVAFTVVFAIAGISKALSANFLSKISEPKEHAKAEEVMPWEVLASKDELHRNFLLFAFLFYFAVTIASPFFVVYMLNNLHFSYLELMAVLVAGIVTRVFGLKYWARESNRYGTKVVLFSGCLVAVSIPLLWTLTTSFHIIILIEALSGFAWSGLELAFFNYAINSAKPETRASLMANYNLFVGAARICGVAAALALLAIAPPQVFWLSGLTLLFAISGVLRMVVLAAMIRKIKDVERNFKSGWLILVHVAAVYPTTQMVSAVNKSIRSEADAAMEMERKIKRGINRTEEKIERGIRSGAERAVRLERRIAGEIGRDAEKAARYERIIFERIRKKI